MTPTTAFKNLNQSLTNERRVIDAVAYDKLTAGR